MTRDHHVVLSARAIRRRGAKFAMLVFALLFASEAFAYLDPGTGSILLQGLIAATAAVVTWLSLTWQQTKAWFRSVTGRAPQGEGKDSGDPH